MNQGQTSRARGGRAGVSASELAQMGVCERLVLFEHRYGPQRSAQQLVAMKRGDREHRRFFLEGQIERRGRCFIATLVYGAGEEVTTLRSFRDRVMRPTRLGRALILAYYRTAPGVCRFLECHPLLVRAMRGLLRPVVWIAAKTLADRGGKGDV